MAGIKSVAAWLGKAVEFVGKMANGVSILAVAGIMLIVCAEVMSRGLLNHSLTWSYDIIEFSMGAVAFLGMAYCLAQKRHIRMDMVVERLSQRTRSLLNIFSYILSLLLFAALVWRGWEAAWSMRTATTRSLADLPLFPSLLLVPVGSFLVALQLIVDLGREIRAVKAGKS